MADFNIRSDSLNVEQIMDQIRARIREKRGVDYTEQQIRELAAVKLEKFLDPRGIRSDLLEEFRRMQAASAPPAPPNYAFGEETLFETHRGPVRFVRRLLSPLLKLFFNPNPLIQALHIQSELNTINAERETARRGLDQLHFEVLHNLVIETTRMSIEIKNLKMRVESLTGRLEFSERRARALESVVAYRPAADELLLQQPVSVASESGDSRQAPREAAVAAPRAPQSPQGPGSAPGAAGEGPGQRSRRRRRRRGRRGGGSAAAIMGGSSAGPGQGHPPPPQQTSPAFEDAVRGDTPQSADAASGPAAPGPRPDAEAGSWDPGNPGDPQNDEDR